MTLNKSMLSFALIGGAILASCGDPEVTRESNAGAAMGDDNTKVSLQSDALDLQAAATSYTIKILQPTLLKKSSAAGSTLPASSKCSLPAGLHLKLDAKPVKSGTHYSVDIGGIPAGCTFDKGYVFEGHVNFPELNVGGATSRYTMPMPGSGVTSQWCVCRDSCSYCSSPHIGWDLSKSGSKASVALNNGTVSNVYLNGTCGWEVRFTDVSGALWLYRHLNKPNVSIGQRLVAGQTIGNHSQYPGSGCGSGPHLHLERLSAGGFRDSAVGKTCRNGYRTCNYDPRKPFLSMFTASLAMDAESDSVSSSVFSTPPETIEKPSLMSLPIATESTCIAGQPRPVTVTDLPQPTHSSLDLHVNFSWKDAAYGRHIIGAQLWLEEGGVANKSNTCGADGADCIVKWELYMKNQAGQFQRVLTDASVRNASVVLEEENRYCAPSNATGEYVVVARTKSGETVKMNGQAR